MDPQGKCKANLFCCRNSCQHSFTYMILLNMLYLINSPTAMVRSPRQSLSAFAPLGLIMTALGCQSLRPGCITPSKIMLLLYYNFTECIENFSCWHHFNAYILWLYDQCQNDLCVLQECQEVCKLLTWDTASTSTDGRLPYYLAFSFLCWSSFCSRRCHEYYISLCLHVLIIIVTSIYFWLIIK